MAGNQVRPRHDRLGRQLRAHPRLRRGHARQLRLPAARRWLKAGYAVVRTDYEGLGTPGVHAYLADDRGPQRARRRAGRPHARAAPVARGRDRRPLAGRPRGAVRRLAGTELDAGAAPARHGRLRARLPPRASSSRSHADRHAGRRARRDRRARPARRSTRRPEVGVPALLTRRRRRCTRRPRPSASTRVQAPSSFGGLPLNQIFRSGADLEPLLGGDRHATTPRT